MGEAEQWNHYPASERRACARASHWATCGQKPHGPHSTEMPYGHDLHYNAT